MASSEGNSSSEKSSGQQWVKWLVIGVLLLAFMVLFKSELGGLINRTQTISVSSSGVEIKTIDTPLGKADVTVVPVQAAQAAPAGVQGSTYTSRQYRFQISWPGDGSWTADEQIGASLMQQMGAPATVKMPVALLKNQLVGGFRPNVNVVVEQVGNIGLDEYMDASVNLMLQMGWQLISRSVDEASSSGFVVMLNTMTGEDIHQVQRIAIAHGNAYVVTASQLPPDDQMSLGLKQQLLNILNSFRIIS